MKITEMDGGRRPRSKDAGFGIQRSTDELPGTDSESVVLSTGATVATPDY